MKRKIAKVDLERKKKGLEGGMRGRSRSVILYGNNLSILRQFFKIHELNSSIFITRLAFCVVNNCRNWSLTEITDLTMFLKQTTI